MILNLVSIIYSIIFPSQIIIKVMDFKKCLKDNEDPLFVDIDLVINIF